MPRELHEIVRRNQRHQRHQRHPTHLTCGFGVTLTVTLGDAHGDAQRTASVTLESQVRRYESAWVTLGDAPLPAPSSGEPEFHVPEREDK